MENQLLGYIIGAIGLLSAMSAWVPLVRFFREAHADIKERARQEGRQDQLITKMALDIDSAHIQIRDIYARLEKNQGQITEMRADLKHIVKAVDGICNRLDNGCKD